MKPSESSIDRRSFLTGTAAIAIAQLLGGCDRSTRETLTIELLNNSVPVQLIGKFRQQLDRPIVLEFSPESQLADLFALLQNLYQKQQTQTDASNGGESGSFWQNLPFFRSTKAVPDLVMLGDYWLAKAIEWEFVQPIPVEKLTLWEKLSDELVPWKTLVTRDRNGQLASVGSESFVWGAPYRWGSMVMAYRRDKFEKLGWMPTDWSDLWKPELRHRISLPNSAREVIGLTLKKLGRSYNTPDLDSVPDLEAELVALQQQVKLYSSDAYLPPLLLEDTWLTVAPSTDILSLPQYDGEIMAVVPQSGTSLWADLWVRPTGVDDSAENESDIALWQRWINFCWESYIVSQLSLLTKAASPILTGMQRGTLPENIQKNLVLFPPTQTLASSEFLNPLSDEAIEQYRQLWVKVRSS
ncbi:extracellular solute-binding protein [Oscillatoriales cyanobacterium LEGE 11467]|uniref:Extracellular solute-binding protein n=1 Tax=Zarconia navalis LEGE 11467 TaxID=1828826 RepID=A0A928Z763_9CYAN|nr:extracellular solute-binding protein [Zarconia navalis]MBE9040225.1 extracellular solute-binding protein [Zarconia navalis LEGE 11467]